MGLLHSLTGMIGVNLTCADPARTLDEIRKKDLRLYRVAAADELCLQFLVARKDYQRLAAYCRKRGLDLRVERRVGIYWPVRRFLSRKALVVTLIILFTLSFWLPTRVLFIRVEGNSAIPDAKILEAAEKSGVGFGSSRRMVRSEKLKNRLLAEIPQLQWVGINTRGAMAVITVREKPEMSDSGKRPAVSSVVAERDGLILSATATKGTQLCTPGQPVQAGQVLISGYTDLGLGISATRAEGEIFAQTKRSLTVVTPLNLSYRSANGTVTKNHSLLIGKKRINFYKGSGISDASCVKMYSKYVLTLPGGFELPFAWVCEVFASSALSDGCADRTESETLLRSFAARYLKQSMIAGTVLDRQETVTDFDGNCCLAGDYVCREMIGRDREEMIGEYHGKDNGTDRQRRSGG